MKILRTIWPAPFKIKKGHFGSLIIRAVIFALVCVLVGFLFGLLDGIPVVGIIFKILGSLMEAYCGVGLIFCVLVFLGIFKA